jgi:hypothetical protein
VRKIRINLQELVSALTDSKGTFEALAAKHGCTPEELADALMQGKWRVV